VFSVACVSGLSFVGVLVFLFCRWLSGESFFHIHVCLYACNVRVHVCLCACVCFVMHVFFCSYAC